MKMWTGAVAALVAMGVFLPGWQAQLEAATTNRVLVIGPPTFGFSPTVANVSVGDTILWTNASSTSHDITQGTQAGGVQANPYWAPINLNILGRAFVTFSNIGVYPYICNQHVLIIPQPGPQTGMVNVTAFNFPPTVDLTSPTAGGNLLAPARITLSATATDQDGTVTNLQLLVGSNIVAEATTSPLSATVTGLPGGNYVLAARAVDNLGKTNVSAPVNLVVNYRVDYFDTAYSPAVLQIKPGETVLFTNTGGFHTVSGSGSEPFCGSAAQSIPSCLRTLNTAGTFSYRCVFHSINQSSGMTGTVSVANFNRRPVVEMKSPASSVTVPAGQNVTLSAEAVDPDGSISAVRFFNGTTPLVTDTRFPFAFVMTNPPPGVYTLTALAADNLGLQATSAPVTLTVVAQTEIRLSNAALLPQGFQFNYTADLGQRYVVEGSASVESPAPFVALSTNTAASNVVTFIDSTAATRSSRQYRVFRQP